MAHILVVDDVDVVRLVISKILKRDGHTVTEAPNGAALDLIAQRIPDAVITDLWMPTIDGLHLIETIKAQNPAVAIIAMSGGSPRHSQQDSLDRARLAGAAQLLMKPIDKDELVTAVRHALDAAKITQGARA
jgi:CheY-like chemotaxis protein